MPPYRSSRSFSINILFLADNFPPERNAQASRVFERACYWVRWGHKVTVITCCPNFPEGKVYEGYENRWWQVGELGGIRVVRVKTFVAPNVGRVLRILDFLSYMFTALFAGLIEPRPDVIVATSPQFFAAVGACALSMLRRLPFVLEISDLWPDSIVAVGQMRQSAAVNCLKKIEMFLYRRATRVVTLTSSFKDNLMSRGIPSDKVDVVVNGVDLERYSPRPRDHALATEWGIAEHDLVVGYIGTLGMAHALKNVLRAAALMSDRQVRFMFVGNGAERDHLIAESEGMTLKNVTFVPAQPKELMPNAWSLCNVALVHLKNAPLFGTVIPSKIFEAMGMGLPILLAAPEGEASHIVRREGVGLCVPAEDPKELASAVLFLEENRQFLHQLSIRSREAAPGYSRERQSRDMLATLNASLAGKRAVTVSEAV
jgi:colanic acid biosynthesis glycosyl transferase WcaI